MEYNRNSYTAQHLAVRVEHCTHNVPWIGMMIQHQPLYCSSHAMHRCKLSVIVTSSHWPVRLRDMNRWAAEAWILQSHTAGQMSMQRRHGEWQSVFWSISTSLANNPFGFIEASFACYLMIMLQPTGCSGASASASAVTLLSTIHLLLLRFKKKTTTAITLLAVWKQSTIYVHNGETKD